MNILILGSGGRECTLAWKLAQSSKCGDLFIHEKLRQELFDKDNLEEEGLPLKKFTVEALTQCLPRRLPEEYSNKGEIVWKKFQMDGISEQWIRDLWTFVSSELECKRYVQEDDNEYQVRLAVSKSRIEPLYDWCVLPVRLPRQNYTMLAASRWTKT